MVSPCENLLSLGTKTLTSAEPRVAEWGISFWGALQDVLMETPSRIHLGSWNQGSWPWQKRLYRLCGVVLHLHEVFNFNGSLQLKKATAMFMACLVILQISRAMTSYISFWSPLLGWRNVLWPNRMALNPLHTRRNSLLSEPNGTYYVLHIYNIWFKNICVMHT